MQIVKLNIVLGEPPNEVAVVINGDNSLWVDCESAEYKSLLYALMRIQEQHLRGREAG